MTGVVVVDKPAGMTSHDVVNRLRRIYGTKRVGHTGTLDPLATGVLVACLGQATRIAEYLAAESKEYLATAVFGVATDSQDVTGRVMRESDSSALSASEVEAALARFRGWIAQVPPMVSAVHHEGRRLYELAREGVEIDRAPRKVRIHSLEMVRFQPGHPARAELRVECSAGVYIRTLVADIGDALGTGGMMESLRRTRVGRFTLEDAFTLESLEQARESSALGETLMPIARALRDWPRFRLDSDQAGRVLHGGAISLPGPRPSTGPVLLLDDAGSELAIARLRDDGRLQPEKVFAR